MDNMAVVIGRGAGSVLVRKGLHSGARRRRLRLPLLLVFRVKVSGKLLSFLLVVSSNVGSAP